MKMKSKKMTKSTFAIIIMAVVMVAMLAFGGTYAYFTASAKKLEGTFTTGQIHLVTNSTINTITTKVVPGDVITSGVTYDVTDTDIKSVVIIHYELTAEGVTLGTTTPNTEWKAVTGKPDYFYQVFNPAAAADFKGAFLGELKFESNSNWDQEDQEKPADMGVTITLTLEAKSIQYDHLTGTNDAEVAASAIAQLFPAA